MMQICPECGHVDGPYWRDMLFNPRTSIARLEDVEKNESDIAYLLKREKEAEIGPFMFKLTRNGWVWRKWTTHWLAEGWKTKRETYDSSYSRKGKNRSEALHKVMQKINKPSVLVETQK